MFPIYSKVAIIVINLLFSTCMGYYGYSKISSSGKCLTPNGSNGICKLLPQCEPLLILLNKGKYPPQPKIFDYLRRFHCGYYGKDPVVCCPLEDKPKDNSISLNLTLKKTIYEKFLNKSCGEVQVQALDRVVGGTEAVPDEFPWMARIRYLFGLGLSFRCGGSLISSRYVLTAAHCVRVSSDLYPISVRLGEYNSESSRECESGYPCDSNYEDIDIEELIPHPDYSSSKFNNDIGLIRLAKPVEFKDTIRPICLPLHRDLNQETPYAVVTGWGNTETGLNAQVLQKVTVPIIPLSNCTEVYKKQIPITDTHICAGGEEGKDSCKGDSGGPLQILEVNSSGKPAYYQYGIVSVGSKICGRRGMPGVYTRVGSFIDWIVEMVDE